MEIKKNLPELRFPEFNEEWLGNQFGDIASIKTEKYNPDKENISYPCIELEHLSSGTGELLGSIDSHTSSSIKNKFLKGEVLFGKLRPYLRKYLLTAFDGVCSSEIWVIKGKNVLNGLIYCLVQTNYFIQLTNQSTGSKMPRADWDLISNSQFFTPPTLPEQQKIADFLTAVDEKLAALKKKKALLEQYKKGVMQKIFSLSESGLAGLKDEQDEGGDKEKNPEILKSGKSRFRQLRFKNENGNAFPDWEEKKLGDFFVERNEFTKNELPLYSLTIEDGVTPKNERYERSFLVKDSENAYKVMHENDFAFNPMNLRFGAIARHKANINVLVSRYYNIFYCNQNGNSTFFEYYLKSGTMINYYNKMATGSLIEKKRVHYLEFIKFKRLLPCLEEQTKIANFLSAIDKKIEQVTTQIETTTTWKKGLLQKMFV